ncbi:MAG: sigma-70 family RNA polymerase sigma factor [Bryobacteraceae bacterium]
MAEPLTLKIHLDTPVEPAASEEEEKLIDALRSGSDDAYELLISIYQQPVYNLVYRLLDDTGDSSDVVQEVFLKIFRNVGRFRGESSLKTWIYRIAVNEAHNHRRWFSRHRRQEVGLEDEEEDSRNLGATLTDSGRSPFDYVLNREMHVLIERALAQINPTFRAAVVLRDIADLSYEEVAEILQVSLGTVKSRIMRGREAMRRELAGRLEPEQTFHWNPQPAE